MAHYVESNGTVLICKHLVDETTFKNRARGGVDYALPVIARIVATVVVVLITGRLIKEA